MLEPLRAFAAADLAHSLNDNSSLVNLLELCMNFAPDLATVTHGIQLAVAPVFVLVSIGYIMNIL